MISRRINMSLFGSLWLAALLGLLAGCSFEPKLAVPKAPAVKTYTAGKQPQKLAAVKGVGKAGAQQQFAVGKPIERRWWKLFHSRRINQLVTTAVSHSPTLDAAIAALQESNENLKAVEGNFFPQLGLTGGAQRQRFSGVQFGGATREFSLYTGEVTVSYTPDIFGLNRLVYRAGKASQDVSLHNLQEAYLTLEGNTVITALQAAALRRQIMVTHRLVAAQRRILKVLQNQYKLGAINELSVINQRSTVAATEATLPPLQQRLAVAQHALATLLGEIPSQARLPAINLAQLDLPTRIPVSLPSQLVRQRPDILSSEALLRAQNAQVGEAVARMYPLVQLTGNMGLENDKPADFFNASSFIWDVAANASVTLFDGGILRAEKRAQEAALRAQIAQYRVVVLQAFGQVADALRALQNDAEALQYSQASYLAARQAFKLAQWQYKAGAIDYLTLLTSQTQYQSARLNVVTAQAQRYQDTAALFVAMGGGWWPKHYKDAIGSPRKSAGLVGQASHKRKQSP
ncbi:MAG: efflux transporter outer membrane subunit [Phycisphaerae bacterium]